MGHLNSLSDQDVHNIFAHRKVKGELHSNYIFLRFALIGLEWDSTILFTKMNFFILPKLFSFLLSIPFANGIYGLLLTNMNIF